MSATRADLLSSLVARYLQLRARLARRLGSQDLASEALHETWLKLQEAEVTPVADAESYLYRAALNTALNLSAASRRLLARTDVHALLRLADNTPSPERVVMAKNEMAVLLKVMAGLKPRERDIFTNSFSGGLSHQELAKRHGVTVRTVQMELRQAILYCALKTSREKLFAPGSLRVSRGE
jgi:RNA polymerase sigma-70 factor (ECF subfamily)